MKRTFTILGVVGLGLVSITAPATAADRVYLCHATGSSGNPFIEFDISDRGLHGHDLHPDDIIPPNDWLPAGLNWTADGMATNANDCTPVTTPPVVVPPVVVPPVVVPPEVVTEVVPPAVVPAAVVPPVVVPPVVVPPVVVPPPAAAPAPKAAAAKAPAAAAVSQGTNQGFNAQTAVGGAESAPTWLAGLGLMLGAGALVAVRRRSLEPKAD